MFFALNPTHALLSDTNAALMATYRAIKQDWRSVWECLNVHARNNDDDYYYKARGMSPCSPVSDAARFIYLNRTCWNGIYRVNRHGQFNTPRGTRDSVIFNDDDFSAVSAALQSAELHHLDFERVIDAAGAGDFVFVDPPYTVRHNHNGFRRYNETIFRWADQERLARCIERARARGSLLLVTNAAHGSIREIFGGLGEEYLVSRRSSVAALPAARSVIKEMAIVIGYTADVEGSCVEAPWGAGE